MLPGRTATIATATSPQPFQALRGASFVISGVAQAHRVGADDPLREMMDQWLVGYRSRRY
jgi:hypothetical protein